jgi:hypothetical protein
MKPNPTHRSAQHPSGVSRRTAVQTGAIGLLGLGMNHLAGLRALGGPNAPQTGRAKV